MVDEAASVATTSTKKKKKNVFKRLAKGLAIKKKKKHPDDASVMGVSVSDASVVNNGIAAVTAATTPPIQIILLLMDPNSRRFELLQLEFDSSKALVSDVLLQIEQSATETSLRDMTYAGVCDMEGLEMIAACKLSMFCSAAVGTAVVLAMPRGMSGRETVELSRPILEDEKVVEMLRPCGVKLTAKSKSRSRSGGMNSTLPKIDEDEKPKSDRNAGRNHLPAPKAKRKPSYLPTQVLGIIIAAAVFFITQQHVRITRPIQSGFCLMPGEWISQCGIWELIPGAGNSKFCDSKTMSKLSMGKDGKLRYYGGGLEEIWSVGAECSVDENTEQCVADLDCQGAAFTLEGKKWFVEVNEDRKPLLKEVIEQFT